MTSVDTGIGDRDYYERWYSGRDWRFYRVLFRDIVLYSEPGPILDLGAGTGFFVEGAQEWGWSCEGLEGSSAAVEIGKKRNPALRLRQHSLSEPLPFEDESFQTVVMNQVIEHLEPSVSRDVLSEILRVLRPQGMALITSPSRYNAHEATVDPTHINMLSPTELRAALTHAGFAEVVPMDSALPLLGMTRPAQKLVGLVHRLTSWDRLSATANCRAYKH